MEWEPLKNLKRLFIQGKKSALKSKTNKINKNKQTKQNKNITQAAMGKLSLCNYHLENW